MADRRRTLEFSSFIIAVLCFITLVVPGQSVEPTQRVILAVGAHAGDMEISCGAVLAQQALRGDRVVLLHLTLGEEGNPRMKGEDYGEQKRREAGQVASLLRAEVVFGPYLDGRIPDTEEARLYVAGVIRRFRPTHVITHWKNSFHKDHSTTHRVVTEAILMAALTGIETDSPAHRSIRGIYFTENWEDEEGFEPFLFVDVSEGFEVWKEAVIKYEFIGGEISSFPYLEYYSALARVRGARHGFSRAIALNVEAHARKRILHELP